MLPWKQAVVLEAKRIQYPASVMQDIMEMDLYVRLVAVATSTVHSRMLVNTEALLIVSHAHAIADILGTV
jgi:hypothetical protein